MKANRNSLALIGKRLYSLRYQWRLTRPQMAARLGVSANAYGKNENGVTFPGFKTLQKLSGDYRVSMDWLIFGLGSIYLSKETVTEKPTGIPGEENLI